MAMAPTQGETRNRFLPEGSGAFFRARVAELVGVAVAAFGLALLAALITYHETDPSLNRAAWNAPRNLIGLPGAFAADLLLQSLGLSAYAVSVAFTAWGVHLARTKGIAYLPLRAALLLGVLLLGSTALAGAGDVGRFASHAGAGGVVGTALLAAFKELTLVYGDGRSAPWIAPLAGIGAVALMIPVMGMRRGHLPLIFRLLWLPFFCIGWLSRAAVALWRGRAPGEAGEPPAPAVGYAEIPGEIDASQYDPTRFDPLAALPDDERPIPSLDTRLVDAPDSPIAALREGSDPALLPGPAAPPPPLAADGFEVPEPPPPPPPRGFFGRLKDRLAGRGEDGRREPSWARGAEPTLAAPGVAPLAAATPAAVAAAMASDDGERSALEESEIEAADDPNPFAPETDADVNGVEEPAPETNVVPLRRAEPASAPVAAVAAAAASAARIVLPPKGASAQSRRAATAGQGKLDLATGEYELPPLDILTPPPKTIVASGVDEEALTQNARLLETVLEDFGVKGEVVKVRPGPVVTLYELEPERGTKASRVIGLADDIARSMSAVSVRVATVPGRSVIGIELPNARRETVFLRELLSTKDYEDGRLNLPLVLGKDIGGAPVIADLARMPHLLIGGTTGSGKSVAINTMILSLLYRLTPEKCRFIMIDPKMLELSVYADIPHLLTPVVTEPRKAVVALKWTVREMENRYRLMSQLGVRNIAGFNERIREAIADGETLTRTVQTGIDPETRRPIVEEQPIELEELPFIVVIIDEMADLMLVAGKDIEAAVQRLAQMARAAGIHVIMATQRPSVDVITGTIKANFPTRISFQVTSKIDSRTILGEQGGEQLLGQGDMLYMAGGGRIFRVHGPFVSDGEVEKVVKHLKKQARPDYIDDVTADPEGGSGGEFGSGSGSGSEGGEEDQLYDQAVAIVCRERKASTSFIQRHLQIGYNRAARIIERMEAEGVVTAANSVGKREVLAPKGEYA